MKMREIDFAGGTPIDGYGPGGFRLADTWREGSLLVAPGGVETVAAPLDLAGVERVVAQAGEIDILLVGQGAEIAPLAAPLRTALQGAGIGVEVMSTPSACRTYNVLLAEQRRVAALLVAI